MRRAIAVLAACTALTAVAPAAADTRRVTVEDFSFSPLTRTASVGDVVRFRWRGDYAHTVKFKKVPRGAATPKSCKLRVTGACKREVKKRGVYRFICTIHFESKGMQGRIEVD